MFTDLPTISTKFTATEIAQEVFSYLQIAVSDFDNDFSKLPPQVFMYKQRNDDFTLWCFPEYSEQIQNASVNEWKPFIKSAFKESGTDGYVLFISLAESGFLTFVVHTEDEVTIVSLDLYDYSFFELYTRKV